ncbi:MAG: FtsX-like permease family protein [Thermoplasmata archaeon]
MKAYPFLKYSFLSMGRNLRRTFFSIIGILVAISLIAGEGISIDSSVSYMIEKQLAALPYEFSGYGEKMNLSQIQDVQALVNNQTNVQESSFMLYSKVIAGNQTMLNTSINQTEILFTGVYGVDAIFIKNHEKLGVEGRISVGQGNATLTRILAQTLGLSPGDAVFLFQNTTVKQFNVSSIVEDGSIAYGGRTETPSQGIYETGAIYIDIAEASALFADYPAATVVYIWAEKSKVVSPADPEATVFNLKRMERNLNNVLAEYGITVSYNQEIVVAINSVQFTLLGIRFLLGGLSLPVIILGVYLGTLGSELNYAERRREIGILKARGASELTIFTILMGEAIFYGVVAGILGLLLGILISRVFLATSFSIFDVQPSVMGFSVSALTIGICVILAIILSLIASYRAAKNVSKITVREALHAYTTEEAKIPYKPKRDVIMVALALITYGAMITISEVAKHPEYYGFQVAISLLCLSAIFMVLVPFSPFFLIIGLSRLVTRISPKIYDVFSNTAKPFLKGLHPLLQKNLKRNPRRASTVCMLISLALAFGLFVAVTYDSQVAYDAKLVKAEVGADIKVTGYTYRTVGGAHNLQGYPAIHGNISQLPGVKRYAECLVFSANAGSAGVSVSTFNASAYASVVPVESSIFVAGSVEALSKLDTQSAIITESFSKREGYAMGDTLRITAGNFSAVFKITGIVKYMPGFGSVPAADIYITKESVNLEFSQYLLFLDVEEGRDVECGEYIRENYGGEVAVMVYSEEVAKLKENPLVGSVYNFLTIEFVFAIIITAVGIGMIMFIAVLERKQEIANMVVRGGSFGQIAKLIWGEGLTVSIVGIILGFGTGALTAFVFNKLFDLVMTGGSVIVRDVVFGLTSLQIVVVALSVLVVTTFIVVLPMKRLKLNEILRWRGG